MPHRTHLMICAGTACVSSGAFDVKKVLEDEIKKQGLSEEVLVVQTGCNGFCAQGPVMVVQPDGIFYQALTPEVIPHLVEEHFLKGRPVEDLMYVPPGEETPVPKMSSIDFFEKQRLIVLRNKGLIDPEKIDEYIARDGYKALAKALSEMDPEGIIEEVTKSGLRGRGGAGFPTGVKWGFCRKAQGEPKYIICNADEGDPGAYMDRSVIESDPHSVIEGMIIGARAIGSSEGYVYIRSEYPLALERLILAIEQAREYGLLGENIFGTDFSFDIKIAQGSGSFVCGEETSLIASIEGRTPEPQIRPPFPATSGLWGKPTNINNVETWANISRIILRGGDWFANIGTEKSKGTKVFSLVGKVNNTGLVEVPMGITLREIIFDIGGGIPDGRTFKAVQIGGPSGGCLPESCLDLPADYESLTAAGSIMGSGGMIVMDDSSCMIDIAKYFLAFTMDESCGRCNSCREGLAAMHEVLDRISNGQGRDSDIKLLDELGNAVRDFSLCALGGTAPNPVLSTLRYFEDEYKVHIQDKKCPAKVCKGLITYTIDEVKCTGCTLCKKNCPTEAITGEVKELHLINQETCIRCGLCYDSCRFDAIGVD